MLAHVASTPTEPITINITEASASARNRCPAVRCAVRARALRMAPNTSTTVAAATLA